MNLIWTGVPVFPQRCPTFFAWLDGILPVWMRGICVCSGPRSALFGEVLADLACIADNVGVIALLNSTRVSACMLPCRFERVTGCVLLLIAALVLSACNATSGTLRPKVNVITPVEGARFELGETISLRVAAASSNSVAQVQLRVAGQTVLEQRNPEPSVTWSTEIQFSPSQTGSYALSVVAIDTTGTSSDPFGLNITVGSDIESVVPPATSPPKPTSTPAPGVIGANGCELSAQFIADVNIPDGTEIKRGEGFVKTWRIKNTSSCTWESGYQLAFLSDDIMGAQQSFMPIPPTAKDTEVDISVPFIAPLQAGVYTSTWKLREPGGKAFGERVYVVIKVN